MEKHISTHAAAAKAIRAEIKKLLPQIKAKVRSECFAGGNAVDVYVSDLCPAKQKLLKSIIDKYQYGSFDGMTDCYDYDNKRDDIPQVKYTHLNLDISDQLTQEIEGFLKARYDERYFLNENMRTLVWRHYTDTESVFWENRKEQAKCAS